MNTNDCSRTREKNALFTKANIITQNKQVMLPHVTNQKIAKNEHARGYRRKSLNEHMLRADSKGTVSVKFTTLTATIIDVTGHRLERIQNKKLLQRQLNA